MVFNEDPCVPGCYTHTEIYLIYNDNGGRNNKPYYFCKIIAHDYCRLGNTNCKNIDIYHIYIISFHTKILKQ